MSVKELMQDVGGINCQYAEQTIEYLFTFPPAIGGGLSRGLGTASGTRFGGPPRELELSCGMGLDICLGALMVGRDGLRFFPLRSDILLRSSDMMGN